MKKLLASSTFLVVTSVRLILFTLLFQPELFAQIMGPELLGAGGTGAAVVVPADSIYLNPATAGFATGVLISGFYTDGTSAPHVHETQMSASITDASQDVIVPAGFRYSRLRKVEFDKYPPNNAE